MADRLNRLFARTSWSRFRLAVLGSFLFSLMGVLLYIPGTNLSLEGSIYDLMMSGRNKRTEPYPNIVIIGIDELTLNNPGQSQPELFSPKVYSQILDVLTLAGAKAVGIYRTMPSGDSHYYSPTEEANWFRSVMNAQRNNIPIIFGYRWLPDGPKWPSTKFMEIVGRENLGFMNMIHDRDDKIRRIHMYWPYSGSKEEYPSWSTLAAKAYEHRPIKVPNNFYIDYRATFPHFSFADVYRQAVDGQMDFFKRYFHNALVLIGETSALNLDAFPVPMSHYELSGRGWLPMPAVEIQAHAIQTILERHNLLDPGILTVWFFFFGLVFLALTPLWLSQPRGNYPCPWLPTVILIIYPACTYLAFQNYVLMPVMPGIIILSLVHILYWVTRLRDNQKVQHTSSQALNLYLNPALAGQIIQNPEILTRRGEKIKVTVFFADLVGFTSMAESMNSEDMVDTLNLYYDTMSRAIERFDGFVDKFVGDAIMAVWGAPQKQPDHAVASCLSALMQKQLMEQLNRQLEAMNRPPLVALMGLNTGQVIAGNIGSKNRFNYTVIGDTVNLASRLVSVNKLFQTTILASEATMELAKEKIMFRALDRVKVVGRKNSIKIYEVLAPIGGLSANEAQAVNYFERGLKHYWNRDFQGALKRFEAALKCKNDDIPSRLFTERCRDFLSNPPNESWDGINVLELK